MDIRTIAEIKGADKYKEGHTVLTSAYVYQLGKHWGHEREVYIPFPQVSSISFEYTAPMALVLLSIIFLSVGILGYYIEDIAGYKLVDMIGLTYRPDLVLFVGVALALICIVFFFLGRKQSLNIKSASEHISLRIEGSKKQALRKFARDIQVQQTEFIKSMAQTIDSEARESEELELPRFSADRR